MRISLKEAEQFHGHLGPYLVLGLLAGELALKKLRCKRYFGLNVTIWGAQRKPKSCLIDGLQISTGATYGKGNIIKLNGPLIKIEIKNRKNQRKMILRIRDDIVKKLSETKTHSDAQSLARKLYKTGYQKVFNLVLIP